MVSCGVDKCVANLRPRIGARGAFGANPHKHTLGGAEHKDAARIQGGHVCRGGGGGENETKVV